MGIYVNTNVSALRGQQYLSNVNKSLDTTYQRLSSGLRINSAKDDAAGLNISDRLTAQINGLNQGNRNANDAIALAQTVEGGLDEITSMLQRMRTLAVQASNGINTADDRKSISSEMAQLSLEISRIADQTTYGGKTILAGFKADDSSIYGASAAVFNDSGNAKNAKISFQVGANSGDTISLEVNSFQFSEIVFRALSTNTTNNVSSGGLDIVTTNGNNQNIGGIDNAYASGTGRNIFLFNIETDGEASLAINTIDKMLADVDSQRSNLGAIQNRLESSIRVQSNVATNESDARSRIRDTDFAEESANLSQQSIIQQAATSMLMQANARPQIGLSLLG